MRTAVFAIVVVFLAAGVAVPQHQHGGDAAQPQNSQHLGTDADFKAMDARLDQKLAAVDAASGEARIDAMAAAIDELLSQRKQMREMITSMQPGTPTRAPASMGSTHGKMGRCGMPGHMMH